MRLRACLIGVLVAGIVTLDARQQPQVFRSSVDLVPVFATVTNPDGSFVKGLTKDDFTVLDNRAPQAITSFSSEAQTISVSVILDTSGSMASALPRVFGAARAFLDRLTAEDRAMVGSLFYVGPPLTTDKARLRTSLDMLPRDPGSPVFAALDRSLTAFQPFASTHRRHSTVGPNPCRIGSFVRRSKPLCESSHQCRQATTVSAALLTG